MHERLLPQAGSACTASAWLLARPADCTGRAAIMQVLQVLPWRTTPARATTAKFYPYRHMVQRWIMYNNDTRFEHLRHPGYGNYTGVTTLGRGYAEHINKYLACVVDGLILHYVVSKVFEIPAAGCLLLFNDEMVPWMRDLGFEPYKHYIPYNRDTLGPIADFVLDPQNLAGINAMRHRAQELVQARHRIHHRVELLHATAAVLQTNRGGISHAGPMREPVVDLLNCLARTQYDTFVQCTRKKNNCCYTVPW